jgi:hypothetical protein
MNAPNGAPHAVETEPEGANAAKTCLRMPDVPRALRGVFQRAESGGSRKAGMDAFCWQCVGFKQEEVRRCSAPECPLYEWRPVKPKSEPTEQQRQWIRAHRQAELKRIGEVSKRNVAVFRRAYRGKSRADAVRAFAAYCLNGSRGPCGTGSCSLAAYCPGAK